MFCYLWWERDKPDEAKFGERWVHAGIDSDKDVYNRVRGSVGVRKDIWKSKNGEKPMAELVCSWDVSEYAKKVGRFYPHSKMDDYLRQFIGHRKFADSEMHDLPPQEVKLRVDKHLASIDLPLPVVGLAMWQASAAENAINAIYNHNRFILADLCARFGKTIWIGTIIREMNIPLTVVASYVLTSFSSFRNDLSGYEQFRNMELVNTDEPDWKDQVNAALKKNKQVVVFVSLCNGTKRQSKIDFLFDKNVRRLVVVDEADYGAHKSGQAMPLRNAMKPKDACILMTGTNADRAVAHWNTDHTISVVYPELVMEKKNPRKKYTTTLKNFAIDTLRHNLVCDIAFYQMNLSRLVEKTRKNDPELFADGIDILPSWTKFAMNPVKAKGFFTQMLSAIFRGTGGFDELNIDIQTKTPNKNRVAMLWLPGSITNKNFEIACGYAQDELPNMKIIPLYGEETNNEESERWVKEELEKSQKANLGTLIISARMGQRSFSVSDITEIYLAYDSGELGATIQKISRALTPADENKVGRIVSLSFDPNRDDKFDAIILETADNYMHSRNIPSLTQALKEVLRTIDIFNCTENGAVKIDRDIYLEQASAQKSIVRVIGKVAQLEKLSGEQIAALAKGCVKSFRLAKVKATEKGITGVKNKNWHNKENITPIGAKLLAKARDVITGIAEGIDFVILGTQEKNIMNALKKIMKSKEMSKEYKNEIGVDIQLVYELFDREIINKSFVELQHHKLVN